MIDPRLRRRIMTVDIKPTLRQDWTNDELLAQFEHALSGKLAPPGVRKYVSCVRDALRYFTDESDGTEIPVRDWTKENVWGYLHYVENNYCTSFRMMGWTTPTQAKCGQRVWVGSRLAAEAAKQHCGECSLFRRPSIRHRLNALHKWFKHLARLGVVQVNFMTDVVSEWYEDSDWKTDEDEKRRNPSVPEMVCLVNQTAHPARRAFYAASAKWWYRANEMFMLDRYSSFGLPNPKGKALGFEDGFPAHPGLASFEDGGDLVYLPKTKGSTDKRKGNRWQVVDVELRPILEQYFAWWERTVKRDNYGVPLTTKLWLNEHGRALQQKLLYPRYFYMDCERLGLMQPGDRENMRRKWSAHCQRHFGEQIRQMANVPADWNNHFRGDAFKDARGDYFKPTPHHIRQKYHELIPLLGFTPLPTASRLRRSDDKTLHKALLQDELARAKASRKSGAYVRCMKVFTKDEEWTVPQRILPSFLFALRHSRPGADVKTTPLEADAARGVWMRTPEQEALFLTALEMLQR